MTPDPDSQYCVWLNVLFWVNNDLETAVSSRMKSEFSQIFPYNGHSCALEYSAIAQTLKIHRSQFIQAMKTPSGNIVGIDQIYGYLVEKIHNVIGSCCIITQTAIA